MTKLDQAKHYVSKGLSVIPLLPKSKKPAIPSWKQYQERLATSEELEEWFGKHPEYNIGIVTGSISNIAVVDCDSESAFEFMKSMLSTLPPTVKTGKGYHLYFKYKDGVRNFQNRDDLPKIDLRGEGGYVVAPQSIHQSGGKYEWLEGHGLDDIALPDFPDWLIASQPEHKATIKELSNGVSKGERNNSLVRLVGSWSNNRPLEKCLEEARLWNQKNKPPLPDDEVERTVRSIFEKHQRELPENILDAMIEKATTEDITELLKQMTKIKSETKRDLYVQKISEKLSISKRAIQQELKRILKNDKNEQSENHSKKMKACFPELVDIVKDESDNVVFLIKRNEELQVVTEWEINGVLYGPPEIDYLTFSLPRAKEIIRWYENDEKTLFNDLVGYLQRFSYLSEEYWPILACFIFSTYIQDHRDIHYLPVLLFFAVPERGKSRTGKALINVAYRGIHLADFREPIIFRYSQTLNATLFFDVMDLWGKAQKNGSEDILLCRFEKGAKASRVLYPDKGDFKDMKSFNIYGSTIIATNKQIHKILDTRCIPIIMPSKRGDYESPHPEKAQILKEKLTAWRAKVMNSSLHDIGHVDGLYGRFGDITKPLLQVCHMVNLAGVEGLKKVLLDIAGQKLEDNRESLEAKIVNVLVEMFPENANEHEVKVSNILEKLYEKVEGDKKPSAQWLGVRLKALGFKKRILNGYSVIKITNHELKILSEQYVLPSPAENISESFDKLPPTSTCYPNNIKNQDVTQGVSEVVVNDSHLTSTAPNSLIKNPKVAEVEVGESLEGEENNNYYERDEELERMKRNVRIIMAQSRGIIKVTDTVH